MRDINFTKNIFLRILSSIIVALVGVIMFPKLISDESLYFSNSPLSLLFFVALIVLLNKAKNIKKNKRMIICAYTLGALLSCMTAAGNALETYNTFDLIKKIPSIVVFTYLTGQFLIVAWHWLESYEFYGLNGRNALLDKIRILLISKPFILAIALVVCWTPIFISMFPGEFCYDVGAELAQANSGYYGDFPLLHSLIITTFIPFIHSISGSYSFGVALYVIIQMIIISILYTSIMRTFLQSQVSIVSVIFVFVYCALFPIIHVLVIQVSRDIFFSVLIVCTIFFLFKLYSNQEAFFNKIWHPITFGIVLALTLMARNNNAGTVMIFVLLLVNIVLLISNRNYMIGAISIFVSSICVYFILTIVIMKVCVPFTSANKGSSLSVMSQALARAYLYEEESWTDDEIEEMEKYINRWALVYVPDNADLTKNLLTINDDNFGDFVRFWLKIGKEHKQCYFDAILSLSKNSWFPNSVVDGYGHHPSHPAYGREKTYHQLIGSEPPIENMNLWPSVLEFYNNICWEISFEKIPVVSMMFSIGFQFWIVLNCLFYVIYRKIRYLYLPMAIIAGYMLISMCVPLTVLRYFAAVFMAMPLIIVFTLEPGKIGIYREGLINEDSFFM